MEEDIKEISIVGSGNVATQLALAFQQEGISVTHVFSRNTQTASILANKINAKVVTIVSELPHQLTIICVPDDAISSVVETIHESIPVAYTSGSVKLSTISNRKNSGVFYPLQTFSKDRNINFFEVPIFIESNNEYFSTTLFDLAWKISREVHHANSEERAKMHTAAVMVNNFTNHLVHLAQKYSTESNLEFNYLKPLLKETILKLEDESAYNSQTGPARRGDLKIITKQLNRLSGKTKEVYQIITDSILETYSNND